jgi:hypothetical protein
MDGWASKGVRRLGRPAVSAAAAEPFPNVRRMGSPVSPASARTEQERTARWSSESAYDPTADNLGLLQSYRSGMSLDRVDELRSAVFQ